MKRLLCILLLISLLLSGCAGESAESTAPGTSSREAPTQKETLPRDYAGNVPSGQELCDFFTLYGYELVKARMSPEEVHYIASADHYALVYFSGMGPDLEVYSFTYGEGQIQVLERARGDIAISGGLSINHVSADGQHIYFGTISDYHWNSHDETTSPIAWLTLRFADSNGSSVDMDMSGQLGYLCILDAPLADFQVIDQGGNVCLDYAAYWGQGYYVNECERFAVPETEIE